MKRRSIVKIAALVIGVPLLLLTFVLLYLNLADLSGWRDTVARIASNAVGRELRIDGEFHPEIGFTTRVVATDITLANADWSDDPPMVSVDRLAGEIDLLSILRGPITIRDVEISGARVLFEVDPEGRFNWALGDGEPGDGGGGDVELVIGHARIDDLQVVYARPDSQTLEAALSKLEVTDDGSGMLDLDLNGSFMESPLEISGRLGTFIGLINTNAVTHDLRGRLADSEFSMQGSIGDLGSLSEVDSRVELRGPDLGPILALIGIAPAIDGPFKVNASVAPTPLGSGIEIHAEADGIAASVAGTVDNLAVPGSVEVGIDLSGPDIRAIADLAGIKDLPRQEYSVTGRLAWQDFPITFDEFSVRVGPNTLDANGILGRPPMMLGTDFRFDGAGPDISALAAIAGIRIPRDDYALQGRLIRAKDGLRAENIQIRLGRSTIAAHGFVGDPPRYSKTSLDLEASIARPDRYSEIVGRPLPSETLEVTGRFNEGERAIALEGVTARLGDNELQVDGRITTDPSFDGTEMQVHASGSDFSKPAELAGLEDAPAVEYEVEGGLRIATGSVELLDMAARIGELRSRASGIISRRPDLRGTRLDVSGSGPGLAQLAWLTGIDTALAGDFEAAGRLEITERGYELANAGARVGGVTAAINGVVTDATGLEGTVLTVEITGHELAALEPVLGHTGLPSAPFSVAGELTIHAGGYELDTVQATVDGHRATVSGTVAAEPGLAGTDLDITVAVPDLEELGRLTAGLAELPILPPEPLRVSTRLGIDERGYSFEGLAGTLGRAEFTADGRVGRPPRFVGTDLEINSDGPDASLFKAATGLEIPVAPFQVNGRLERLEDSFRFHRIRVRVGEHQVFVDGSLGEPPEFVGTDLEIHASGPDTNLYEALAGLPNLPDTPFTIDGRFHGTPELFSTPEFRLTFGDSHLEGEFKVDITGKPAVEARLNSRVLDLRRLRDQLEVPKDATHVAPSEANDTRRAKGDLLFRDEPLNLAWLQAADADVAIRIDRLYLRAMRFRDLAVDVHLEEGRLEIERAAAAGRGEGRMTGSLLLEPIHDGYRLETDISLRQIRLDPPEAVTQLLQRPPIDIDIDFEAVGASPHELAGSTNGTVQLVIGTGIFDSSMLDLVTADILLTLLNAFNPFAKEDPTTELQCGVALLSISDGIAKLEPMAFQSDKMTLLGEGKINLETEKLNLSWVTKPRKGIGVSASMITNPYIKLGGTLSNPSIELKPLEAMTSTGVAVATMGISLVAKGLFDRVTAEKKVCKKALEEIGARSDGKPR
jgi:uncharacterized protein involved in outer membrane biogenesis